MQFDQSHVDELRLQYELSMAVGTSLDTHTMLKHALSVFLRQLNCAAGSIYLCAAHDNPFEQRCAIPRNSAHNQSCVVVQEYLENPEIKNKPESLRDLLPVLGGTLERGYHHILELPDVGIISLFKYRKPLPPSLLKSLGPVLGKLANASRACLQNEELAHTHRETKLERNMLRTLIENTPIVVFAVDRDGIFKLSEGYGLQELGRAPGEIVGQSIFDYYADAPEITRSVRKALDGEACSITVDVAGRSFDARYEPVVGDDGRITGAVGVAHDITERKVAAETLTAVLNTVGEGIITIDSHGEIVMFNNKIELIFGHQRETLLGKSIEMLMPEQYRDFHRKGMYRYLSTGVSTVLGSRVELEGLRMDGTTFPLEIQIDSTTLSGKQYFTASMRDITARLELERMRDDFVSTVSHELRTPLASVMGWTETLMSERPGPLSEKQRRFLDIVYRSSERLDNLVEEILTVSRIQRGTLQLSNEPFYPAPILEGVLEMMESTANSQSVSVQLEDHWPRELAIIGDGRRMEQVLNNLVENAIKFSPDNSEISVHSSHIDDRWQVRICDNGIGIAEEEIPHLFERFYRADSAREAQIQGTGIGLYVCNAIIEGHDGEMTVNSKIGIGTTVTISIPASHKADRADNSGS